MSADSLDAFPYETSTRLAGKAMRRHYWATAIGLQAVDGLEVSPYLRELAQSYEQGRCTLQETGELIRAYHTAEGSDRQATAEADLVSQRIAEMLEAGSFAFTPDMLLLVHRTLFQDMDEEAYRPGQYKTERLVKQEDILNGDSVLYADPLAYEMALKGVFATEQAKSYGALAKDELAGFCHSIAFIWQIHPFYEGNTRTVAVFSALYLNQLGFDVSNEPFEHHARYFRDALVRAMYRNAPAGIFPDEAFLVKFYESLLGRGPASFDREELMCLPLFENPALLRNVDPAKALDTSKLA